MLGFAALESEHLTASTLLPLCQRGSGLAGVLDEEADLEGVAIALASQEQTDAIEKTMPVAQLGDAGYSAWYGRAADI